MGGCISKNGDSSKNRVARWRSTGIVALRDSSLKVVPSEVFSVDSYVRTLDLTNNKIVEIPSEISKLINMQRLALADNIIVRLPANLGNLKSLKVLTLDGNRITTLPDELGSLTRLERLSITRNSLMCLPKTVGDLHNGLSSPVYVEKTEWCISVLKEMNLILLLLDVSNNKLKSLPESIGSCISLEELQANGNSIENLPPSICNLTHLKSLSLNNNSVHKLPQNLLKDCKSLQSISLHDNPISMDEFQQMEGFQEFEARRKKKFDKQIDSNVMMSSTALDEGLDL